MKNSLFAATLDILFENSERDSLPRTFRLKNHLSRQEQPQRARRSVSRSDRARELADRLFAASGLEPARTTEARRVIPLAADSLILIFDVHFSPAPGANVCESNSQFKCTSRRSMTSSAGACSRSAALILGLEHAAQANDQTTIASTIAGFVAGSADCGR